MNRSLKSFVTVYVLALGALGLMAGQASALVRCSPANTSPITGAGALTVISSTYPTTFIGQAIMISYNAECSIGGAQINWLDTNIIIDPAGTPAAFVCAPSSSDNALCSGNGTASSNDGWVSAVTNCVARVSTTGIHSVRVVVTPSPLGTPWRIDDQSLICVD